jgi:NADH dehydrogenase
MQEGELAAANIIRTLRGRPQSAFRYRNLGNVVSVGTRSGAAQFGGRVIGGFAGWLAWRAVHLARITNMRNQLATALDWTTGYFYDVDTARLDLEPAAKAS